MMKESTQNKRPLKNTKKASDFILQLQGLHNKELKVNKDFQEDFLNVVNSNLRWLLAKTGDS